MAEKYSLILNVVPWFWAGLFLNDCVCSERWSSRSTGPVTEDSCLPILQLSSEVSWDFACLQVRTLEGRHHLVPVTERQGLPVPPSLLSVKVMLARQTRTVPGRLTGWHRQELPIMPPWWRAWWPWDRMGSSPLREFQTAYKRMNGWRHILYLCFDKKHDAWVDFSVMHLQALSGISA